MKLSTIILLARASNYHEENKAEFKKQAVKFLRRLARVLNLTATDYVIRYNAGGIAVSGFTFKSANPAASGGRARGKRITLAGLTNGLLVSETPCQRMSLRLESLGTFPASQLFRPDSKDFSCI